MSHQGEVTLRWRYGESKLSQTFNDSFLLYFFTWFTWPRWLLEFMLTDITLSLACQVNFFTLHHENSGLSVRLPDGTPLEVYWTRHSKKVRLWYVSPVRYFSEVLRAIKSCAGDNFWCTITFLPVSCFPTFVTSSTFSRALYWLRVFPRFALVTRFPALCTGYVFSRALHWLRVFPRFALVTCFLAV